MTVYNKWVSEKRYGDISKKKMYIAGPMRGCEDYNFAVFNKTAAMLEAQGYQVVNPADNMTGLTAKEYIMLDLSLLSLCDSIYMLSGWRDSLGATVEYSLANYLGLEIIYEQ